MYSKFGTRRSTFQKRTYKILISDFKLSIKNLRTKPNKAFTAHLPCMNMPDSGPEHVGSYSSVSQSHPSLPHPFLLWTGDKQKTWLNFKLLWCNLTCSKFSSKIICIVYSISPVWNQFLILTFTYMYICSISTKELDSLNLKKLICSHARGFKLRWLKKLKEIAIWKVSLNPVEHLDLLYPGSSNPNPIQDLHREGHCSMI